MVFNATLNNISVISWESVLLVEETGGSGENHRRVAIRLKKRQTVQARMSNPLTKATMDTSTERRQLKQKTQGMIF